MIPNLKNSQNPRSTAGGGGGGGGGGGSVKVCCQIGRKKKAGGISDGQKQRSEAIGTKKRNRNIPVNHCDPCSRRQRRERLDPGEGRKTPETPPNCRLVRPMTLGGGGPGKAQKRPKGKSINQRSVCCGEKKRNTAFLMRGRSYGKKKVRTVGEKIEIRDLACLGKNQKERRVSCQGDIRPCAPRAIGKKREVGILIRGSASLAGGEFG